jgi:DNA-binding response OmpR family regulator
MVEFRLAEDGHEVVIAADGARAREQLDSSSFDLVLLDVMMPRVDGFALCRELATGGGPTVILVSALARDEDLRTGAEAGAADYVTKPFDPDDLARRVAAAIAG